MTNLSTNDIYFSLTIHNPNLDSIAIVFQFKKMIA